MVAWLCVTLPNLRPPPPQDQLNYLEAAASFPNVPADPNALGGTPDVTHQVLRFGLTLPTRLAIEVFGYSQAAYYAVPLFTALLLLVSVYAVGCLLFGRAVGAAGAVLVMTTTPIFREQSYLMPDLFSAALFAAVVALCVAVRLRRLPRNAWVLLAIGTLLAWSYLVREFAVFGWPLVPVLLWRRGARRSTARDLIVVAIPVTVLVAVEMALCWLMFKDPLLRLKVTSGHGQIVAAVQYAATYRDLPRLEYVFVFPKGLPHYGEGRWMLGLLALAIIGGAAQIGARLWRLRDPATRIFRGAAGQGLALLFLWCALYWVPLTLLGGVLDPSAPKLRLILIRYWYPIYPAFVLGGLGAVWLLARHVIRRLPGHLANRPTGRRLARALPGLMASRLADWRLARLLPGLIAIMVAAAPVVIATTHSWGIKATRVGGSTHFEAFRSWMAQYEKTPDGRSVTAVWTDTSTDGILQLFRSRPFGGQAWSTPVRSWRESGPHPQAGDLLFTFGLDRRSRCLFCRLAMTRMLDVAHPRLGPVVFATPDNNLRVYRVLAPPAAPR